MKKLMSIALGLTVALGGFTLSLAQDQKGDEKKEGKKGKGKKKKKKDGEGDKK